MKLKTYLFVVFAIILASCTENQLVEEPQLSTPHTIRISAALPGETTTRTIFQESTWDDQTGYGMKLKWAEGDKISILCWQGDDAANWGQLISDKDTEGNVISDKGEIIHTLATSEISADGRSVDFEFNIPAQITNSAQPVKVLVTYLGETYYTVVEDKPYLYTGEPAIRKEADRLGLLYVTRATPMILRGEIAAGWNQGTPTVEFGNKFAHITTLLAVQVKNSPVVKNGSQHTNAHVLIDPEIITVKFHDGKVMNSGTNLWNPLFPAASDVTENQVSKLSIANSATVASGESFVYFIPTYIVEAPHTISVSYKNRVTDAAANLQVISTSQKTNNNIAMQPGKCYLFNVQVGAIYKTQGADNYEFKWNTESPVQAPIKYLPDVETALNKSNWSNPKLPTDNWQCPGSGSGIKIENLWDGDLGPTASTRFENAKWELPNAFTIDLGENQNLRISRIKLYNFNLNGYTYRAAHPKEMEIWGSNNPDADGGWNNWTLLTTYQSGKPSDNPVFFTAAIDFTYVAAGEEVKISADKMKVYRYLRFKTTKTWDTAATTGATSLHEITVWGY